MARQAKNRSTTSQQTPANQFSTSASSGVPAAIMGPRILILIATLALLLLGFVMVYSASSIVALNEGLSTESYLVKQLIYAAVGIVICVVIWKLIPYHIWLGPLSWLVWGLAVFLLLLVALIGNEGYGATRWVDIGPFSLQPSEFAKIVFMIMTARIIFELRNGEIDLKTAVVQGFVLVFMPLMLIFFSQSDLGTTLICFVGILMVLWLGEIPLKLILGILAAGLIAVIFASTIGYRADRFIFLNPWDDGEGGLGTGYQLIHSYYAFAQGGLFGVGLGNSREKFLYLPMSETDFIYAIIGEELGLIGALIVIVLFIVFLYAGLKIAQSAPDGFGTMLAGGLTAMIVFQAFLNIGCVIGVLPTTGKPLPFISSGGSSLMASLIMFGLILSVSQGSNTLSVYEQRRNDLRVVRARNNSSSGGRSRQFTSHEAEPFTRGRRETSSARSRDFSVAYVDGRFWDRR